MYHANVQFAKAVDSFTEVIRCAPLRVLLASSPAPHTTASISKPDRRVYESRGMVYQDLLDHARAVEDFTMAIKLGPDFPIDHFHRGESYLRLAQYELALQDFDYAMEFGPQGACLLPAAPFRSCRGR
jgi:tetratricopeptide (TPR) repeat protein